MDDKYDNNELYQIMKSVEKQVVNGFKGIHKRQDETNGNVKENSNFRIEIKGQFKVWKWIAGFIGLQGFVVIIIGIIMIYKGV